MSAMQSLHYYTCRHTFEATLIEELERNGCQSATTPCEAVVRASGGTLLDPVYALQALPLAAEVRGASVKALADAAAAVLGADGGATTGPAAELLEGAPKGTLSTHVLVPDVLRGTPPAKAKLMRRVEAIEERLGSSLRKRYACARRRRAVSTADGQAITSTAEAAEAAEAASPLLLQLLLLTPELLVVSVAPSRALPIGYWPARRCGGLASTDLDGDLPSSAYRKLLEAFACAHAQPAAGDVCVDLGASPGGWSAALLRLGATVTAVDRSPLAPALMAEPRLSFVQGDAFAFTPAAPPVDWAVSDVIAFPERAVGLIEHWCGAAPSAWAHNMVVTIKFKGATPDWEAIDAAVAATERHGFRCRVKHFFANKHAQWGSHQGGACAATHHSFHARVLAASCSDVPLFERLRCADRNEVTCIVRRA